MRVYYGDLDLTEYPFGIEFGTDLGAPVYVAEALAMLLADGEVELSSRASNRTLSFNVVAEGADLGELAENEALLVAECEKDRNLLVFDPEDYGVPTAFETFRHSPVWVRDEALEAAKMRRAGMTIKALPYGRSVDETVLTPTATTIGTARQRSYTFDVAGSARTEARLAVAGASSLGGTLLYSRPGGGGAVPLRQHRTAGGSVTADAATVSGSYDANIETAFEALVPKADVPDGTYLLFGRLRADSGSGDVSLTVTTGTQVGGFSVRDATSTATDTLSLSTSYTIHQLGPPVTLPAAVVGSEADAEVFVSVLDAGGGLTVRLDEVWLFEVGSGSLTWPETGSYVVGMPAASHLWVEPATVERGYRRLLRGTEADQSDALGATSTSWGSHTLEPGENTAFLVTDDDTAAVLTVGFFNRWHTYAALVP